MDRILRRSSFFYASTLVVFAGLLGNYLGRDPWPAFEVLPLFMPIYLGSAVGLSEKGESYGFLRTLPITDRAIVRRKFALILGAAAGYWLLMLLIAVARLEEGASSRSTLVYVTLVCGYGLLVSAAYQLAIWRFGHSAASGPIAAWLGVSLVLAVVHTAGLRRADDWPVLADLPGIAWLSRSPWLSAGALAALFVLAFWGLMRLGVRVKATSEACL